MSDIQRIIVFGATGPTGRCIVSQALERGHSVTAFVRDAAKLDADQPRLTVIEGDIADADAIDAAFSNGADAVISALGIFTKSTSTELSDGTVRIIDAMQRHGVSRLIVVSSLGAGESAGHGNFVVRLIQKTQLKYVLEDKNRQEDAIRASGLDWTILRPPRLMTDEAVCPNVVIWRAEQPTVKVRWEVNRATVAALALDALAEGRYIRDAINFSDPK